MARNIQRTRLGQPSLSMDGFVCKTKKWGNFGEKPFVWDFLLGGEASKTRMKKFTRKKSLPVSVGVGIACSTIASTYSCTCVGLLLVTMPSNSRLMPSARSSSSRSSARRISPKDTHSNHAGWSYANQECRQQSGQLLPEHSDWPSAVFHMLGTFT